MNKTIGGGPFALDDQREDHYFHVMTKGGGGGDPLYIKIHFWI